MRKFIALAVVLLATAAFAFADAVSGSLPFVFVDTTGNGTNLANTTDLNAPTTLTSGGGTGDFAGVPVLTIFGPMNLNDLTIGAGGGFAISNPLYGSFVADSGTIVAKSANFLNVDMVGLYTPGPGLSKAGLMPAVATAHATFNQTGDSLSGAFTLSTVPEQSGLLLMGSGLALCGFWVRRAR